MRQLNRYAFGSEDPLVQDMAARKLQSIFRRRIAINHLRNLVRSMFRKLYDSHTGQYFYQNALTGDTSWSKPVLLGAEDFEKRYRRVPIEEHNVATFIQTRHRGRAVRRWFRTFLLNSWEWRVADAATGRRYYLSKQRLERVEEKPVLLVKWDLEPAEGKGELEADRRARLERERVAAAQQRARGEACLVWLLAKQLVEEETVLHTELAKKKERIKQKLAVAAKLATANNGTGSGTAGGSAVAAAAKKKVVFSGDSILASIGL